MRVSTKRLSNLTPAEWERCSELNFGPVAGDMYNAMRDYRHDPRTKAILCRDDNGEIIGWSLAFMTGPKAKRYRFHYYVSKRHRGKGIGTRLMKASFRLTDQPFVYPHDEVSGALFDKFRNNIRPVYGAEHLSKRKK